MSHNSISMGERGRVVIPSDVRRRLGIEPGDTLLLSEVDGGIKLEPLGTRIASLQGSWRDLDPDGSLVDELIAERRAETERD